MVYAPQESGGNQPSSKPVGFAALSIACPDSKNSPISDNCADWHTSRMSLPEKPSDNRANSSKSTSAINLQITRIQPQHRQPRRRIRQRHQNTLLEPPNKRPIQIPRLIRRPNNVNMQRLPLINNPIHLL